MTTPTSNPVPSTSPLDLLFNAEKIDQAVNSPSLTYLDRFGAQRLTLAGATAQLKNINPRGAWAPATAYDIRDVALVSGTWWICVEAHVSSAAFATDQASKWRVYQGVTSADLGSDSDANKGSGMVGFGPTLAYEDGTVGRHLKVDFSENYAVETLSAVVKSQAVNVRAAPYFAGGIGVTDDTGAFTAALATGKSIYVPAGIYNVGPQTVSGNGQCVFGDGRTATIKPTSLTAPVFTLAGDNQAVRHLVFDGGATTADGQANFNAIKITGTRAQVVDNRFIGVWTRPVNLVTALYCVVRDNNIDGMRKRGVSVQGGTFNRIEDNMIFDASLSSPLDALVYIDNAPSVWIVDNHITRGTGVGIKAVATPPPSGFSNTYIVIEGNDIDNLDNYAISVDGYWNVQVHHNWCSGGQGSGSTGQITIDNANLFYVAHNDVKGSLNNGQGITLTSCKYGFVHNNTVEYSVKGVVVESCENVIFRENIVGQLTGLPPTGSPMQYGFFSTGLLDTAGCEFLDNKVIDVTVQPYSGIGNSSQLRPRTVTTESDGSARMKNIVLSPGATAPATNNGDLTVVAVSNTQLRFSYRGSDGTLRSNTLNLS